MDFLTTADFNGAIASETLAELEGTDSANLNQAETNAISELDPLYKNYNIEAELAKTETARNNALIRLLVHCTIYYLYNSINDLEIPERVNSNYDNAISQIAKISNGKLATTLQIRYDSATGENLSNYRFGSNPLRDNSIF